MTLPDSPTGESSGQIAAWLIRLLLSVLMLFASSVLLWTDILSRSPLEWAIYIVGTLILTTLILDMAVRYRVRDIYDVMALIAIYGILYGLLITPAIALSDFPRTLITRVLGGHALVSLEMFGLFLALTAGENKRFRRLLLPVAGWLGFYLGVWVRWNPPLNGLFEPVSLETVILVTLPFVVLSLLLFIPVRPMAKTLSPDDLLLPPVMWAVLALPLIALFLLRVSQSLLDGTMVVVSLLITGVCWMIIWFRRSPQARMLLDRHLPAVPLSFPWIGAAIVVFGLSLVIAYHLPLVGTDQFNQLWLMEAGFAAVGFLWLPLVGTVVAFRGIDRQMRQGQSPI